MFYMHLYDLDGHIQESLPISERELRRQFDLFLSQNPEFTKLREFRCRIVDEASDKQAGETDFWKISGEDPYEHFTDVSCAAGEQDGTEA